MVLAFVVRKSMPVKALNKKLSDHEVENGKAMNSNYKQRKNTLRNSLSSFASLALNFSFDNNSQISSSSNHAEDSLEVDRYVGENISLGTSNIDVKSRIV